MAHTGYLYWGRISRPHGFKGEVSLIIENDIEFKKKTPEAVFLEKGAQLLPYFVQNVKESNKGLILGLEECISDVQAKTLNGFGVYVREIETKKSKKTFSLKDLVGYEAIDKSLGSLGEVVSIMEMPMQQLLVFEINGKEVLVPAVEDFIVNIDNPSQKIHLELPEGLVDVYLNPSAEPDDQELEESQED